MSYKPDIKQVRIAKAMQAAESLAESIKARIALLQREIYGGGAEPAQAIYNDLGTRGHELIKVSALLMAATSILQRLVDEEELSAAQQTALNAAAAAYPDGPHHAHSPLPTAINADGSVSVTELPTDPEPEPVTDPEE